MAKSRGASILLMALIAIFIILILVATFFLLQEYGVSLWPGQSQTKTQTACPQDAKVCPDGSSVGRVAPSCNFAPCPNVSANAADTTGWNMVSDSATGFSMEYPNNFFDAGHQPTVLTGNCNYAVFPATCPNINTLVGQQMIAAGGNAAAVNSDLAQPNYWENPNGYALNINNADYCLYQNSNAATGHVYNDYYYVTVKNQQCFVVSFATDTENCSLYLPITQGDVQQLQNYQNCVTKDNAEPQTLQQILNTFTFSK